MHVHVRVRAWRRYDPRRTLRDVLCLKRHVVLEGREDGLTQLWAMDKDALGAVVIGPTRPSFPTALPSFHVISGV
jgi:hypothetical protein